MFTLSFDLRLLQLLSALLVRKGRSYNDFDILLTPYSYVDIITYKFIFG